LNDLKTHANSCTMAVWHHPLYSTSEKEPGMQAIWNDLYNQGADVVLNGHLHRYERWAPQDGSGNRDNAYGVREFIVGSGGRSFQGLGSNMTANFELGNDNTFGVLKMTLHANSYDWQFLPAAGGTFTDSGTAACHGKPGSGQTSNAVSASGTFGVNSGGAGQLSGGLALLGLVAPSIDRRSRRPSRLAKRISSKRPGLVRRATRPIRRRLARRWPHPVTRG
jgi:hypothetical protein